MTNGQEEKRPAGGFATQRGINYQNRVAAFFAACCLSESIAVPELPRSPVQTHVDTLAPAVGNMHGMLKAMVAGTAKKRLDIERIRAIKAAARVFLTLHGASGTDDEDLRQAIAAGIGVVHINTEVRLAWRHGLDSALSKKTDEIVPYKILPSVVESVRQVVTSRLALFGSGGRSARSATQ